MQSITVKISFDPANTNQALVDQVRALAVRVLRQVLPSDILEVDCDVEATQS
jgi:hypothetical protein